MLISIICPVFNEEKYIQLCIESILNQDVDKSQIEVLFVDGMSTDKTCEIVKAYQEKYSWIKLVFNQDRIVPISMNIGIKLAKGDIIFRIDAHAKYAYNYISMLAKALIENKADNVGAVCKTDVLNTTSKSSAIKEVLSHPLGVGNSMFRIGVNSVLEVDTVPFGCFRRESFDKFGLYNERLIRNQDIELNKRILRGGGKILLIPNTFSTYFARENYSALAKNNFQNGLWNILTVFYTKEFGSLSTRHFIPLLFVLSIFIPAICSFFWLPFIFITIFSVSVYVIILSVVSVQINIKTSINVLSLLTTFIILHLSYGIGSLFGLFRILFKRK